MKFLLISASKFGKIACILGRQLTFLYLDI